MEALQQKNDIATLNLNIVKQSGDYTFIVFLQTMQNNSSLVNLTCVTIGETSFFLLQREYDAYLVKSEDASSPEYARFFANVKFFVDTERDLPTLLHNIPIEQSNIHDFRIAKSVIPQLQINNATPFFKISQVAENFEINFSYIKNLLIKGFEVLQAWNLVEKKLHEDGKFEVYQSIICEKFKKVNLYNAGNFAEISDLYNALSGDGHKKFSQVHEMLKDVAVKQKMPLSSIATLSAIEALCLRNPQSFDDIANVSGFNKRVVHNAVIRKLMGVLSQYPVSIKRNRPMEMAIDTLLTIQSLEYSIEKNLIASKHDIIACLNGNLNVDFLKGWKKSIFGDCVLKFLQGEISIQAKNMQLFIVTNE